MVFLNYFWHLIPQPQIVINIGSVFTHKLVDSVNDLAPQNLATLYNDAVDSSNSATLGVLELAHYQQPTSSRFTNKIKRQSQMDNIKQTYLRSQQWFDDPSNAGV